MFAWLSAKKSEAFGHDMALLLMESMPGDVVLNDSKRLSKSNFVREKMKKKIRSFKQEEILNTYKISKLLNKFKWTLKDANYDSGLADTFASWILITLRSDQ